MALNPSHRIDRDTADVMRVYFKDTMGRDGTIAFSVFVIILSSVFIFLAIFNCMLVVWQKKLVFKGGVRLIDLPKKITDPMEKDPELFA